jgi:hypothetical protein
MVSCSAHRGRGGAFNCLVGASDSLFFFCRSLLSADLHHLDGPKGETNFARGGGALPNHASFSQRVMVSCSAHRGRGGAFNCLVGASDSLFFFCRSLLSADLHHLDGPQGETNFACGGGALPNHVVGPQSVRQLNQLTGETPNAPLLGRSSEAYCTPSRQ